MARFMGPSGKNACLNPEAFEPDPGFRTVDGADAKAYGIDLDGEHSRSAGKPARGTCAHNDLVGLNGERGIDNQFFRVVGCSNSFQSTGQSNTYEIELHTGSWGILMTLDRLDDIRNDDDVEVGFFANADPIELSTTREPLPDATYAIQQDPRFQARTRGRIKNGVLTTDPVDMRFHWVVNSIRPLCGRCGASRGSSRSTSTMKKPRTFAARCCDSIASWTVRRRATSSRPKPAY